MIKGLYLQLFYCIVVQSLSQQIMAAGVMRDISSMDLVNDMVIGWNLGNSLDATGGSGLNTETSWGNPFTTKAMIDAIKAKGFKTVRIPVTWNKHFGSAPDYPIDQQWFDRVTAVVNYVIDNRMYAILNFHHDEWVTLTSSSRTEVTGKLVKLWTQVANRFRDYGDYLIFETLNEPRLYGQTTEWTGGTTEARSILNGYNAAAVSAIRATGRNNALRHIMIPTHAATAIAAAQNDLVIPENDKRIIISQHTYWPYQFTMEDPGVNTWGTDRDKADCIAELDRIQDKFVTKGIPVIVGEWGAINKNNTSAREIHAEFYAKAVRERGMLPVWWDNGFSGNGGFGLIDRNNLNWTFPQIADALVRGAKSAVSIDKENSARSTTGSTLCVLLKNSRSVTYVIGREAPVSLCLYDLAGNAVFSMLKPHQSAGSHVVELPVRKMPSGTHILKVTSGNHTVTRTFHLIN